MTKQTKKKEKFEFLYGVNPVFEALKVGKRNFRELIISRKDKPSARMNEIIALAERRGVPVNRVSFSKLTDLAGSADHQGVGGIASPFCTVSVEGILSKKKDNLAPPFILLLDSIVDPQNLGALIRTALCSGVDGIVVPKDRAASPTPSVSKASAGAMEHADIALVTNLVKTVVALQKEGLWITGLDQAGDQSLYEADLSGPLGIIIGGEGRGIRPLVRKTCDFMVSIPQKGDFNSLNASVAGAITMYEVFRQRLF